MQHAENANQIAQIRKVTIWGMLVNIGLALVKFIVGLIGSSQAVIADAVHSLSDMATDIAVIFGVKFWSAPPDKDHPYGHGRIEALVTVAIALALLGVAVGLGYNAFSTINSKHDESVGWIAIYGPIFSIIFKEALYHWTVRVGKEVKSSAVIANAWHHRSDVLSSIPALIAVIVSAINPQWNFVDSIGAIIISVFILKVSWDIIIPALHELSDSGASQNDRNHIKEIALQVEGVKSTHAIRTRKFGASIYVDLHILVSPELTVRAGHDISEDVKVALMNDGPDIVDVIVHLEPYDAYNLQNH